jgi:hypothetical protein
VQSSEATIEDKRLEKHENWSARSATRVWRAPQSPAQERERAEEASRDRRHTFPLASVYAQDNEQLGQVSRSDGAELSPFLVGRLISTDVGGFIF